MSFVVNDTLSVPEFQNHDSSIMENHVLPDQGKKQILIVLHQEQSTPGRIGCLLRERGYELDMRRPRFGDPLPKTLQDYAGAIILGGPMSANDDENYIRQEIDWISVPLTENKPFLGICLGAQMLARNLGATVRRHDDGLSEIGYYKLTPTEEGHKFAQDMGAPWPSRVYHWHSEGFDCPCGAQKLASGEDTFPNQAIRVGQAGFGLQFHPEVTYAMMCRWTTRSHEKLGSPGAKDRCSQFADRMQYDPQVARWLNSFLDYWLSSGGVKSKESIASKPQSLMTADAV